MSSYATEGGYGSVYAQHGSSSGSVYAGGHGSTGGGGGGAGRKKKRGHGGILGVLAAGGSDLYHAAVNLPAGLYVTGKATAQAATGNPVPLINLGKSTVKQTAADVRHPLRHPGFTALDLLGALSVGAGTVARGAAVAGKIGEGARAGEIASAALRAPKPGVRAFRVGGLEVEAPASRSPLRRGVQRTTDTLRQRAAARWPAGLAARLETRKAGRALAQNLRHEEAIARAPANALLALGKGLTGEEQWALRLVAEQAPVEGRMTALRTRIANAKTGAERRRHQKRLDLTEKARPFLGEKAGMPTLAAAHLRDVYGQMEKVAGSREELARELGLLTDEAIQGRKTAAGRAALGATYEKPTPGKLGKSKAVDIARARAGRLQKAYDRLEAKGMRGAYKPVVRPRTEEEARVRLSELEAEHNRAVDKIAAAQYGPIDRGEVARRNINNARARRQQAGVTRAGRPSGASSYKSTLKPTVKEERRRLVEQQVEDAIARNPNHPVSQRWRARTEEIDALQEALNPMPGEKANAAKFGTVPDAVVTRSSPILERMGGALSVAKDDLERAQARAAKRVKPTGIIGHEEFVASPGAVYVPDVEQRVGRRGRITATGAQGVVGQPVSPVKRGYTGGAKASAREPLNTTRAVAEAQLAVTRFHRLLGLRDQLVKAARPAPRFASDVAVRLDKLKPSEPLPRQAREFLDHPDAFTPDETAGIFESLRKRVLLAPEDEAEFARLHAAGKIGYVPKALLGDLAKPHAPLSATVGKAPVAFTDALNNAFRASTLYLKPAYGAANVLGNAALTVIQQGFAAPANVRRAVRLTHDDRELASFVDTAMQEGFSAALHGQGPLAGATHGMANLWGKGVDVPFRRAAFFHEAHREGFRSLADLRRLRDTPELRPVLNRIMIRANAEIIDYGKLSAREREVIRRILFVYPWVKGSTVYAGRFLGEHPTQAAVAGAVGQQGERVQQEAFPLGVPTWAAGLIPTGGTSHGLPTTIDPSSVALFATPAQVGEAAVQIARGNSPAPQGAASFYAPQVQLLAALLSGQGRRQLERQGRTQPLARVAGLGKPTKTYPYTGPLAERLRYYALGGAFTPRAIDPVELARQKREGR